MRSLVLSVRTGRARVKIFVADGRIGKAMAKQLCVG